MVPYRCKGRTHTLRHPQVPPAWTSAAVRNPPCTSRHTLRPAAHTRSSASAYLYHRGRHSSRLYCRDHGRSPSPSSCSILRPSQHSMRPRGLRLSTPNLTLYLRSFLRPPFSCRGQHACSSEIRSSASHSGQDPSPLRIKSLLYDGGRHPHSSQVCLFFRISQ